MDPFHLMTIIMDNILIIAKMIVTITYSISINIKHADCDGGLREG